MPVAGQREGVTSARGEEACEETGPDCVARARAVAPRVAAAAEQIERERALPQSLLAALHEARLFRMLLPRSCGGDEVEPVRFVAAVETIAKADASTAWCVAQASGCAMSAAYLDPAVARHIFGPADAVLAWGPAGPGPRAVAVAGGWRLSGTWSFASGSRHAQWLGGHCTLCAADGTPRLGEDGRPVERTLLFPRAQASITDVWQVMGLKGTGSDTYAVADLFVPAGYAFTRESAEDRRETGPLYRFTTFQIYAIAFAAVALGIARATLDAFLALARTKVSLTATKVLRENGMIQSQAALAEARLQSARSYLVTSLDALWDAVAANGALTLDERIRLRLAATWATFQAREVVDAAYHAAGATAIFASNPFERRFRDMHTVSQQVQANMANFEIAGQALLGLAPASRVV